MSADCESKRFLSYAPLLAAASFPIVGNSATYCKEPLDRVRLLIPQNRLATSFPTKQRDHIQQHQHSHHHFQRKHPPLVELSHHKFVQLARGLELVAHQSLVIRHADS